MITGPNATVHCTHCGASQEVPFSDLRYRVTLGCDNCDRSYMPEDHDRIDALFEVVADIIDQLNR
jgi:transcription elongation factor Elf1